MTPVLVPIMLFTSSLLMALAWLGHIRYRDRVGFGMAVLLSWFLVLPEYVLNIVAIRYGHAFYTGGAMASFTPMSSSAPATSTSSTSSAAER